MELRGTGYMIETTIDSCRGVAMSDLEFELSFFVHVNRRETFQKKDLVCVKTDHGNKYYAFLDSRRIGDGNLMCDAVIKDPEAKWNGGTRPVILRNFTGKVIGGKGGYIRSSVNEGYEEGYKVTFNFVWGLPKAKVAYVFYGHLVNQIRSYSEITSDMLVSPENYIVSVPEGNIGRVSCGMMEEGDKVVVLIPVDAPYYATKDNGFGGQMPFSSQIMGSNGENIVMVDGEQYRAYGEMMTTEGEMFVYVN